jgi:hypothetical protein
MSTWRYTNEAEKTELRALAERFGGGGGLVRALGDAVASTTDESDFLSECGALGKSEEVESLKARLSDEENAREAAEDDAEEGRKEANDARDLVRELLSNLDESRRRMVRAEARREELEAALRGGFVEVA